MVRMLSSFRTCQYYESHCLDLPTLSQPLCFLDDSFFLASFALRTRATDPGRDRLDLDMTVKNRYGK